MRGQRNPELIKARNKKLCERFKYMFETKRLRFDDVIQKLKWEEFFLEEKTIMMIIKEQGTYKNG